jgi:hypothetical protein
MGFNDLKKKMSNIEKLSSQLDDGAKQGYEKDKRFWTLADKKQGSAIIRFLPPTGDEDVPYVRTFSHGFQGPGGWLIEECPTTLGRDHKCPICELNTVLWNRAEASGDKTLLEVVRSRKRKLNYISNILVVKDPANPENEGKVFLFKYGKKIYQMIDEKVKGNKDLDIKGVNVFSPWDGCNFRLKAKVVDKYTTYESSTWADSSSIGDDEQIEAIWKSQHSLLDFIDASKFKSYDQLKQRLTAVLKETVNVSAEELAEADLDEEDETEAETPAPTKKEKVAVKSESEEKEPVKTKAKSKLEMFKKLAEEEEDDE